MPEAATPPRSWPRLPLAVIAASCPLYAALALAGDLKESLPFYLAVHAALFVLYLAAVRWGLRPGRGPAAGAAFVQGKGAVEAGPGARQERAAERDPGVMVVLAGALIFRLILLPGAPSLSDDVWRYIWEGRVQWQGYNPYRHAPSDPELAALRDEVYERINHKHLPAIYPPLTQAALALGSLAGRSPFTMKALFVAADLGLVLILMPLLRRRGVPPARAVVYAWNPLAVVEVAGSGHNDPLALALLLMATAAIIKDRPTVSMTSLALSGLAKLYAFILIPLFASRARRAWMLVPALAVAGYLPYAGAGGGVLRSTIVYAESWQSNDLLFGLMVRAVRWTGVSTPLKEWADARGVNSLYSQPHMLARALAAALLAAWMLWLSARVRRAALTVERGVFLFTGAILLLMPTLHPWYLLWILPWLALFPSPAWLALTGLVPLAYTGAAWAPAAQVVPFFALLAASAWRRRRAVNAVVE